MPVDSDEPLPTWRGIVNLPQVTELALTRFPGGARRALGYALPFEGATWPVPSHC